MTDEMEATIATADGDIDVADQARAMVEHALDDVRRQLVDRRAEKEDLRVQIKSLLAQEIRLQRMVAAFTIKRRGPRSSSDDT